MLVEPLLRLWHEQQHRRKLIDDVLRYTVVELERFKGQTLTRDL